MSASLSVPRLMLFHRQILLVLLSWLLAVSPAPAQDALDLYTGEIPVASKSEQDRAGALGQALRQVIGKLTGLASPQSAIIDEAAAAAGSYLQQFQYRGQENGGDLTLWARFNAQAMDEIVAQSGLPAWSRQRPPVLTWIALRNAEGVELFNLEDPGGLAQAIRQSARQRGLPLEFPLLDLEDRARLTAAEVWNLDIPKLLEASGRYGAGRIFVARIEQGQAQLWTAQWSLLSAAGEARQWSSQGTSMEAVVAFGINTAADRIARREALTAAQAVGGPVRIRVSGLRNLDDYARVMQYLQSFEQVSDVAPRALAADRLQLRLAVRGGRDALAKLISFGDVLRAEVAPAQDADSVLGFSLRP